MKIDKLRKVIVLIRDIINSNDQVHVSFGVFEALNSLAESEVRSYRMLDCLKGTKSNFDPTFEESKVQYESESSESEKSNLTS